MTRANPAGAPSEWRHFVLLFLGVAALAGLACIGFVAALDPYGLRAGPGRAPGPLMDGNQRFMYPQVARSGAYDGAVFGTSTLRLLDPAALERAFGGRFANLSMNAATPYEQAELARLYLRHNRPKALVFGIDPTWCEPEAAERRLTFRAFPAWLYRPDAAWGVLRQVNGQSVSTAADALLSRLGIVRARLAANGYAVFTPPEGFYDAARAQAHIRSARAAQAAAEAEPGYRPTPADAPMPALGWLDALLAQAPPETRTLVVFPPVHVAQQGAPGSPAAEREAACKAAVTRIGAAHGATVVDFRIPSPITRQDTNYWDPLHYRLPIAARIVADLKAAQESGRDDPEGGYRVLAHAP
ncbi:SGNH/GDSL hydrolase family protein [Methylorubrum thiocyanatum]